MAITKSQFMKFRKCPVHFWFLKHKPEVLVRKELSDFEQQIIDQGIEVEQWARRLYPDGELVDLFQEEAVELTRKKIIDHVHTIFQASFAADGLYSMSDIINWNPELQAWDIYEVKGTTSKQKSKKEHYWDVAFQREVVERSDEAVGRLYLVELNKEYIKDGGINVEELLIVKDITEEIDTMRFEIQSAIGDAKNTLAITVEYSTCDCFYNAPAHQCDAFSHLHPNIPSYSVYNIARIGSSKKKLAAFVDADIFAIEDIPDDNDLSQIQSNQVFVYNHDIEIFKHDDIRKELEKIEYPIYFLDYETIPTAIPLYDACYPFQQVPFQYSLHIQHSPESELIHAEFLHLDKTNPIPKLAAQMRADIGDKGSVIVWNKKFEGKCNEDMANQIPDLSSFLLDINQRMYDLMDIFHKQYYVKKEFLGKTSIKNVLPALAPEFSYSDLNIQDGGVASSTYKRIIWDSIDNALQTDIANDLLEYCKLDTLAMVEILRHVRLKIS